MKISRITKVAGAGLAGFVAVALVADKTNAGQGVSQIAGFVGAFLGSLVARQRARKDTTGLTAGSGKRERANEGEDKRPDI